MRRPSISLLVLGLAASLACAQRDDRLRLLHPPDGLRPVARLLSAPPADTAWHAAIHGSVVGARRHGLRCARSALIVGAMARARRSSATRRRGAWARSALGAATAAGIRRRARLTAAARPRAAPRPKREDEMEREIETEMAKQRRARGGDRGRAAAPGGPAQADRPRGEGQPGRADRERAVAGAVDGRARDARGAPPAPRAGAICPAAIFEEEPAQGRRRARGATSADRREAALARRRPRRRPGADPLPRPEDRRPPVQGRGPRLRRADGRVDALRRRHRRSRSSATTTATARSTSGRSTAATAAWSRARSTATATAEGRVLRVRRRLARRASATTATRTARSNASSSTRTASLSRAEEDLDHDGTIDTWTYFDGRRPGDRRAGREGHRKATASPTSSRPTSQHGDKTVLAKREEDKNGDGKIDVVSIYENGKLKQRQINDPDARARSESVSAAVGPLSRQLRPSASVALAPDLELLALVLAEALDVLGLARSRSSRFISRRRSSSSAFCGRSGRPSNSSRTRRAREPSLARAPSARRLCPSCTGT